MVGHSDTVDLITKILCKDKMTVRKIERTQNTYMTQSRICCLLVDRTRVAMPWYLRASMAKNSWLWAPLTCGFFIPWGLFLALIWYFAAQPHLFSFTISGDTSWFQLQYLHFSMPDAFFQIQRPLYPHAWHPGNAIYVIPLRTSSQLMTDGNWYINIPSPSLLHGKTLKRVLYIDFQSFSVGLSTITHSDHWLYRTTLRWLFSSLSHFFIHLTVFSANLK